ncbi:sensor histidine kinase, partial [candidate division GN15 bacterium]
VEAHNGSIAASNRQYGGACFVIELPIEDQPEIPAEEEKA